jgi:hypothetical protein
MTKTRRLSAALLAAALLTTPAMARQDHSTSPRPIANARIITTAHSADGQTRSSAGNPRGLVERDMWGHWGAYYGPMVVAP